MHAFMYVAHGAQVSLDAWRLWQDIGQRLRGEHGGAQASAAMHCDPATRHGAHPGLRQQQPIHRHIPGAVSAAATPTHSTQAFRRHKQVHVFDQACAQCMLASLTLPQPGTADLTADVNFAHAQRAIGAKDSAYAARLLPSADSCAAVQFRGPVTQSAFLEEMGIQARMETLLKTATPAQVRRCRPPAAVHCPAGAQHPGRIRQAD